MLLSILAIGSNHHFSKIHFAYHRIRMEGVMLDEPGGMEAPGVHDESRSAQVAQVAV